MSEKFQEVRRMKRVAAVWFVFALSLFGAELRLGESSFDWRMDIAGFMHGGVEMDVDVVSLDNSHDNFGDTKWYYGYGIDLYGSDFVDRMTTLATYPLTYEFPQFGSLNDAIDRYTMVPIPSEYKIRGLDLDFTLGYDFFRSGGWLIAGGVDTGISMPVMKMKNLKKTAQMTYKLLEATDTKVVTYKFAPAFFVRYAFDDRWRLSGRVVFGIQKGTLENDWFRSSIDIDGRYRILDLNLRYRPLHTRKDLGWITLSPALWFTVGYTRKRWEMDEVKVDMSDILEVSTMGELKIDIRSNRIYFGAGVDF